MGRIEDRERKNTGRQGEDEACRFLEGIGHKILRRNFRAGGLEIDIISRDGRGMHFVEVKTRRTPLNGNPEESVNHEKQRRIARAAMRFFADSRNDGWSPDEETFFDVVSVVFDKDRTEIKYFEQAYIPIYT